MSVKVTSNTAEVLMKVNTQTNVALRLALEDIHRNSNSITPMKTGDLRTKVSKSVIGNQGIITWESPYAIYQENPRMNFKYTTPGTGGQYAKKSVEKTMQNFPDILMKAGVK